MLFVRNFFFNIIFYSALGLLSFAFMLLSYVYPKSVHAFRPITCNTLLMILKYVMNLTYKMQGNPHLGQPVIYASKHQSAWETAVMSAFLGYPNFILKKELLNIPGFGFMLKKMQMIPVDRKNPSLSALKKMVAAANHTLEKNQSIIIFPEGTRVQPNEPSQYKAGIYFLYKYCNVPIVPVALNSGKFWPRNAWLKKPGVITVQFLDPIPEGLSKEAFMTHLQTTIDGATEQLMHQ